MPSIPNIRAIAESLSVSVSSSEYGPWIECSTLYDIKKQTNIEELARSNPERTSANVWSCTWRELFRSDSRAIAKAVRAIAESREDEIE